jgi:hypothetical protein
MATKMTLTRALAKLKTLDARIASAEVGKLFAYKIGARLANTNLSEQDFSKTVQSTWDEVNDLVQQRVKIKSAIMKANSETYLTVNGESMTIADAVARKEFSTVHRTLLTKTITTHNTMLRDVTKHNQGVSERLDKMLESLVGKDKKMAEGEFEAVSKPFLAQNEATLLDPHAVYKKAGTQLEELEKFLAEVDFCLSEVNAKTEIEVAI